MKAITLLLLFLSLNVNATSISAKSWLIADDKGTVLKSEYPEDQRSIASITKLMSAMVVLDANQNLKEKIGGYTREQHLYLSIVRSVNTSADILCRRYPGGMKKCIDAMNEKAVALGMSNSYFADATGINAGNKSTALDLIKLVLASKEYPLIVEASRTQKLDYSTGKSKRVFNNTNPIVGARYDFVVSKTGLTTAAGGCIVMMLDTEVGRRIVVLLGSRNGKTRIPEAEFLALLK